jgi:hypothetical protein
MRHGSGVEVIAGKRDRAGEDALAHHPIDGKGQFGALTVSEPGDPRRQAFERHIFTRQGHPIGEDVVFRKGVEQIVVDFADIVALIGERNPTEGAYCARE